MNNYLPDPIRALAALFKELPGVGPKTALRFVFSLLKKSPADAERLARGLLALHSHVKTCTACGAYAVNSPCTICKDPKRDQNILCLIAESRDIAVIEATGEFNGRYHILGGLLSPIEGATPDTLRLNELFTRLASGGITEIIFALSNDLKGESTSLFLVKRLANYPVKITRLARGLPMGADLEYADEVTLADALRGRREIEVRQPDNVQH